MISYTVIRVYVVIVSPFAYFFSHAGRSSSVLTTSAPRLAQPPRVKTPAYRLATASGAAVEIVTARETHAVDATRAPTRYRLDRLVVAASFDWGWCRCLNALLNAMNRHETLRLNIRRREQTLRAIQAAVLALEPWGSRCTKD
jgi:hypothetical protein